MNIAQDNKVFFRSSDGDTRIRATCDDAGKAAEMLNRAAYLNDAKRKYTAAARLIAAVECLPNFHWKE